MSSAALQIPSLGRIQVVTGHITGLRRLDQRDRRPGFRVLAHDERTATGPDARRTVDITTIGRRSGQPRRIEIWFHNRDGRIYISGRPGRRGWYANVVFVFHLKETAQADIPARALPITDPAERRRVLSVLLAGVEREGALEDWVDRSPLIEVQLLGREDAA